MRVAMPEIALHSAWTTRGISYIYSITFFRVLKKLMVIGQQKKKKGVHSQYTLHNEPGLWGKHYYTLINVKNYRDPG